MIVNVRRGAVVESRHQVHAVAVDASGRVLGASGDAARFTYMRSAFKPLQALTCLLIQEEAAGEGGAGDRLPGGEPFSAGEREIAVACGSHAASAEHVAVVKGLLERVGCSPEDLSCGVEPPGDADERARLAREGLSPSTLHSNCSGKHAFMVATCRASSWFVRGYGDPDHPLQRRIRAVAARFFGIAEADLEFGVDGCGLPAPAVELWRMALAYARLADAASLAPAEARAAARLIGAMREHPHLTRDDRHFAVELMRRTTLFAKPGADGVLCAAPAGGGWGLALKVEDGAARALAPAAVAAMASFGLLDRDSLARLAAWEAPALKNVAGTVVGALTVSGMVHGTGEMRA